MNIIINPYQRTVTYETIKEGQFFEHGGHVYGKLHSNKVLVVKTLQIVSWNGSNQEVFKLEIVAITFNRV